jgi:hypothetical protein
MGFFGLVWTLFAQFPFRVFLDVTYPKKQPILLGIHNIPIVGFFFCLHIFCTISLLGFVPTSLMERKKEKKLHIVIIYLLWSLFWVFILFA